METASYIALSRQSALRRQMDVVSNNLANMNSTAYKSQSMLFAEYINTPDRPGPKAGSEIHQVTDLAVLPNFAQGRLEHTGNSLNAGLDGPGFLVVETAGGPRYTRDGTFHIDADHQLVDNNYLPLLDEADNPIIVPNEAGEIVIASDGAVSGENGPLGRLKLVEFETPYELVPLGGGLFVANAVPQQAEATALVQGMLEGSNVDPISEMTRMIEVHRAYQQTQNFLEGEHERQRSAIRDLPRTDGL